MNYYHLAIFATIFSIVACNTVTVVMPGGGAGGVAGAGGGDTGGAEEDAGTCPNGCDDDNPCTDDECHGNSMCSHATLPDSTVCSGTMADPIHGECITGSCLIKEWTCDHEPTGTPCQGGVCTTPKNGTPICCTGCIWDDGSCSHLTDITGGASCCKASCDDSDPNTVDTCSLVNPGGGQWIGVCQHN
jgi:hypothetical protein